MRGAAPTCRICSTRATGASPWSGAELVEENAGRKMTYPVKLTVFCDDRAGMLKEMTAVISDDGTNIRGVDSKPTGGSEAMVEFVLEAEDMRHLTRIVSGLRRVPGVRDVQRAHKDTYWSSAHGPRHRSLASVYINCETAISADLRPHARGARIMGMSIRDKLSSFYRKCATGHRALFPGSAESGIWSTPRDRLRSIRRPGNWSKAGFGSRPVRVLENLKAVLAEAGSDLHHVVKTTVFLKNMGDFAAMNEIYAGYLAPEGVVCAGAVHSRSGKAAQRRPGGDRSDRAALEQRRGKCRSLHFDRDDKRGGWRFDPSQLLIRELQGMK